MSKRIWHLPVYNLTRYCRLCKVVLSAGQGRLGRGAFGVTVLCCDDCLVGYAPSSYAVVQPRLGRRKTVATTEYYGPVDLDALPNGKRGKVFDPRPQLTVATACRVAALQSRENSGKYTPPSRFRVR